MKNPAHCLLIDDDNDDKDFFNLALRKVCPDAILHYSPSGTDAIENLRSGNYKPDYIFLDLNLTPASGLEVLAEIKKIPTCTDTPVIIYSGTINEGVKYKTLSLGAYDHFEKPSSQAELEACLKRILQAK